MIIYLKGKVGGREEKKRRERDPTWAKFTQ